MNISYKTHREIWQNGLVLGTVCLGLGILYLFQPWEALPYSDQLLFIGAGVAYFFSFLSFKKVDKQQNQTEVSS